MASLEQPIQKRVVRRGTWCHALVSHIGKHPVGVLRMAGPEQAVHEGVVAPRIGGDPRPQHFVEQVKGAHREPAAVGTRDEGVVGDGVGSHPGLPHPVHDGYPGVESGDPAVRGEEGVVGDDIRGQAEADGVDDDGLRAVEPAAPAERSQADVHQPRRQGQLRPGPDHGSAPSFPPPPRDSLPGSAALRLLPRLPYSSLAVCWFATSKADALSWRDSQPTSPAARGGVKVTRWRRRRVVNWGERGWLLVGPACH